MNQVINSDTTTFAGAVAIALGMVWAVVKATGPVVIKGLSMFAPNGQCKVSEDVRLSHEAIMSTMSTEIAAGFAEIKALLSGVSDNLVDLKTLFGRTTAIEIGMESIKTSVEIEIKAIKITQTDLARRIEALESLRGQK